MNNKEIFRYGDPNGNYLESGEIILTATGNKTTPFIKVKTNKTNRQYINEDRNVKQWLIDNVVIEAKRRDDEFSAKRFSEMIPKNLSQSDIDDLHAYLFDRELCEFNMALENNFNKNFLIIE